MNRKEQIERFEYLVEVIKKIMRQKGSNYGTEEDMFDNLRECERIGIPSWIGIEIRNGDKTARIRNAFKDKEKVNWVTDDKPRDDLFDRAIYSLIQLLLLEEEEGVFPKYESYMGLEEEDEKPRHIQKDLNNKEVKKIVERRKWEE